MPQHFRPGFSLPTSTALMGLAGAGAMLGALPGLSFAPAPLALASLPLLGAALWLRRRREGRIAARLRGLRLGIALPMAPAGTPGGVLAFRPLGSGAWQARRDGWQIELRQGSDKQGSDKQGAGGQGAGEQGWQLRLARLNSAEPAQPLAGADTLEALLGLARGMLAGLGDPALAALLDCDLCFPLPAPALPEDSITLLAEGGYALREPEGCRAIAGELAERMIRRGSAVPAAPF
jgi:hypothetical protein